MPTHPTLDNYLENAWYYAEQQTKHRLYVTSRLDILTTGVLVFAKSPAAQAKLNGMFAERRVKKIYRAITETPVPLGRHAHYMNLEANPPKPIFAVEQPGSCLAALTVLNVWPTKALDEDCYGCEIELETGRTHQIRAQLALLGKPILGDRLYGSLRKFAPERIALECFHISFTFRSRTIGIYRPTPLVAPHSTKDS